MVLSDQKTYPYEIWEQNYHFVEFYGDLGDFWTILGKIGGQWRHKRGQDFKISEFWHHHRFSHSTKHTHAKFENKTIIYSCFIGVLGFYIGPIG